MKRFPETVRKSMEYTGSSVTCLPVQFDAGDWESAIFFQVGGGESKLDRRILSRSEASLPVAVETDLIEHVSAAVVMIRLEVFTEQDNPLVGEVLLTPGQIESHFETLKLLSSQRLLRWFFADAAYWIIHQQQNILDATQNAIFQETLNNATAHDSLIRITGKYDAEAAIKDVLDHYEFRNSASAA